MRPMSAWDAKVLWSAGALLPLLPRELHRPPIVPSRGRSPKSGGRATALQMGLQLPLNAGFNGWMRIAHAWQIRVRRCIQVG